MAPFTCIHVLFLHFLVFLLTIRLSVQAQGLELALERERIYASFDGSPCSQVTCRAKGNSVSITRVSVSKANSTGKNSELLAITSNKPEAEVLFDKVRGNGSLEKNFAFIRLELVEKASCESDYFICKASFVLSSGETGMTFAMAGPGEPLYFQTSTPTVIGDAGIEQPSGSMLKNYSPYASEIWFLGNKVTRVEGKFEAFSERLDKKINQNVDEMRERTGTLENTVLGRVASVETEFSARTSRLEDRVSSILLSHSSDFDPIVTKTLEDFERKLELATNSLVVLNETFRKQLQNQHSNGQPETCERGMGNDVTKWYLPYVIMPYGGLKYKILCDTHTDGGGWIVVQRRVKGDVDFYRDWTSYRDGFGSLNGDFWIGNEALHNLTDAHPYELRIDVRHDGRELFAEYSSFRITSEADNYKALIGTYKGTFGFDAMAYHNNRPFSTFDKDNDENPGSCAISHHGAWWYGSCHHSHLNGVWGAAAATGVSWYTSKTWRQLYFTEMKIRRTEVNKNL